MAHALALAVRGLGRVSPNPAVGCVIVRDGVIVGRGWTQPGGRPHAETMALAEAGELARGATACVTLEPCSHHGETGPCAEALIDAGIARVVVALGDPDERVSGRGIEMLREAGLEVVEGVLENEARDLNQGFLLNRTAGRPLVTLKLATSMDGRIATATGHSQWITGPAARRAGHMLRATHDVILTGARTVRTDDPELTCRIEGLEDRSPTRVVMDANLTTSPDDRIVATAFDVPTFIFCGPQPDNARFEALCAVGATVIETARDADGHASPQKVLAFLAASGATRVLVEAGARLSASFLRAGLVDRIALFRSGKVIGADGLPGFDTLGIDSLDDAPVFTHSATQKLGQDVLETWHRSD